MPHEVVDKALELLCSKYVFPERAQAAAAAVRARLVAGDYDGLDETAIGERLTAALFEHCGDKHLRVRLRDAALHEALTEVEVRAVGPSPPRWNSCHTRTR